jgi:hypothetical protein
MIIFQGGLSRARPGSHTIADRSQRKAAVVSVPSHIKYMTSALRTYIDRQALEDLGGKKIRRIRQSDLEKKSGGGGGNRWRAPCDLRRPAPADGRPTSRSGATSFHFALTSSSKTSAAAGAPAAGGSGAADHERYISADQKVEIVSSAVFDRYLGRVADAELESDDDTRAELMVTNIADTQDERASFWEAATAHSRTPTEARITLNPGLGALADWQALADDDDTPDRVANYARDVVNVRAPRQGTEASPKLVPLRLDALPAAETEWAGRLGNKFGRNCKERLVHFAKPRGGLVQYRLVAEFPDVFGPAQKCAVVAALKADFERLKFRYTVVVHTPDHTNDGRNEHLHALWYEGPCERTADGKWSFDRSAGLGVKLRPGEIARILRDPAVPCPDTNNPRELAAADVRVLRTRFAGYCNRELESLGSRRQLDPRRYEDMGIDQEPSEHLGTDAARLVAAGVSVDVDYAMR